MSESIALEEKFQSKFTKKFKKTKERLKSSGTIDVSTRNKPPKPEHGTVYVGHIPHGFYENEMTAYFKQFGKISSLKICRSRSTGESKGYAFVEFADAEVAKIAAETMDNYLMFSRRLIAKYIPSGAHPLRRKYKGASWSKQSYPLKATRALSTANKNKNINAAAHLKKSRAMMSTVNKNLKKLRELGINYRFKAVDVPNNLNENIVQSNGEATKTKQTENIKSRKGIQKKKNATKKK